MKAMILAAGFGKRMLPLTEHTPKPLLKVGGKALIEWHLEKLSVAGVTDVVINTAYLAEKIENYLGDGSAYGLKINYSRESEPLETAGGIQHALDKLGAEPFLLLNGDVWSDIPLGPLVERARSLVHEEHYLAHLVLVENPAQHPKGDFCLKENGVLALKQAEKQSYTYSGMSILNPSLFVEPLCSNKLAELLLPHIKSAQVSAEIYAGRWEDVGTPERLTALNNSF